MKTILSIIFILALTLQVDGQIQSTWKGGTPGHEKCWNIASNWTANNVPDEFTDVIIPLDNSFRENYPVIRQGICEIRSIWIHKGAKINVSSKGDLMIYSYEYSLFERGQIIREFHYVSDLSANTFSSRGQ